MRLPPSDRRQVEADKREKRFTAELSVSLVEMFRASSFAVSVPPPPLGRVYCHLYELSLILILSLEIETYTPRSEDKKILPLPSQLVPKREPYFPLELFPTVKSPKKLKKRKIKSKARKGTLSLRVNVRYLLNPLIVDDGDDEERKRLLDEEQQALMSGSLDIDSDDMEVVNNEEDENAEEVVAKGRKRKRGPEAAGPKAKKAKTVTRSLTIALPRLALICYIRRKMRKIAMHLRPRRRKTRRMTRSLLLRAPPPRVTSRVRTTGSTMMTTTPAMTVAVMTTATMAEAPMIDISCRFMSPRLPN